MMEYSEKDADLAAALGHEREPVRGWTRVPPAAFADIDVESFELPSLRGVRVLLADDSFESQALLMRILSGSGADVDSVADGAQAVAVERFCDYDVIVMDVRMPELDGVEATRRIRERGFRGPIVAVTAHSAPGERERCLMAGADRFLCKPVERASLIHAVWDASLGRQCS